MERGFSALQCLDSFPVGLRVLAVDGDLGALTTLERMLLDCSYQGNVFDHVTTCTCAVDALSMLNRNDAQFDILLTEVHMPEMNGLQLLTEIVTLRIQLPVVLFSADQERNMIIEGISRGACIFLAKPFSMDVLMLLWQYVLPTARNAYMERGTEQQQACNLGNTGQPESDLPRPDISTGAKEKQQKKKRFTWTAERHNLFIAAIEHLGHKNAIPKNILAYMQKKSHDPGLNRHVISSHLQKFRATKPSTSLGETALPTQQLNTGELSYTTWMPPLQADQNMNFPPPLSHGLGFDNCSSWMNEGGGADLIGKDHDDILLQKFLKTDVYLSADEMFPELEFPQKFQTL